MTPAIREEIDGGKGRFVIDLPDGGVAELTFSIASPRLRIADHTGVSDASRGSGHGEALVAHLVADARARGYKVVPLCPFVNAQRRRHPEWADVFDT